MSSQINTYQIKYVLLNKKTNAKISKIANVKAITTYGARIRFYEHLKKNYKNYKYKVVSVKIKPKKYNLFTEGKKLNTYKITYIWYSFSYKGYTKKMISQIKKYQPSLLKGHKMSSKFQGYNHNHARARFVEHMSKLGEKYKILSVIKI